MDLVKSGRLSTYELNKIKKEWVKYRKKAGPAGIYNSKDGGYYNSDFRSGRIYFSKYSETPYTFQILQSLIIEEYAGVKFDFTNISSIQYASYNKGDKFKWHRDPIETNVSIPQRSFTMSLNITDGNEYEGGELLIKHDGKVLTLGREAGSYIIFPAFLRHQACEVLSGTREAIVVWTQSSHSELDLLRNTYKKHYIYE